MTATSFTGLSTGTGLRESERLIYMQKKDRDGEREGIRERRGGGRKSEREMKARVGENSHVQPDRTPSRFSQTRSVLW